VKTSSEDLRGWVLAVGAAGLLISIVVPSEFLPEGLSPVGGRTLGCAWMMAWWWIGSRLPLAVPALVPLALFPILGITDSKAAAAPYADRMIMLLLCGFLLAQAVGKWNLHRRVALQALVTFGRGPRSLGAAVMGVTALLSMWISNTATTLMMLPIVLALVATTRESNEDAAANLRFGSAMLLGLAWSASIGGMATHVGTPPNLLFVREFTTAFPDRPELDGLAWMKIAAPIALVMLITSWGLLWSVLLPVPKDYKLGDTATLKQRLAGLGRMTRPELLVAIGFGTTAFFWVFRKSLGFPPEVHDSTIAAVAVILFFLFPSFAGPNRPPRLLDWGDAKGVPWGLLLLFGGGIALSTGFKSSGLTTWLGGELTFLTELPAPLMVAGLCLSVTFLTEITSNTATTALILPVLAALSTTTGTDPLLLMLPATLAASCAFMLPVATAPNAIVVGSGELDGAEMARAGLVLNLVGVIPITIGVLLLT
jgi:solute carrier family 13 (sodium-dependent dicarboxylate transporter), member 2/3/5